MNLAAPGADTAEIVSDPHWFLEGYDHAAGRLRFVRTAREDVVAAPFLAQGYWDVGGLPQQLVAERDLAAILPQTAPPPHLNFIWHTAFCCSTAIANALDCAGKNLSLKEPGIVLSLADARRQNVVGSAVGFRFPELVFRLLARGIAPGEQVTIKPTNFANYAMRDAAGLTEGRHLLLYSDCRSFLISVLKKGEYGRRTVRELYAKILRDGNAEARWPQDKVFAMTDMQVAAVTWHMQIAEFRRSWPMLANGRGASLDCDAYLARPVETLTALDDFLGLGLGRAHFEAVMASPAANRHSKDEGVRFGAEDRQREHREFAAQFGAEIDETVRWSYQACPATPRECPVPAPLVTMEKSYLP
ncbi:MAG: hypothetical protein ACTHLR_02330 [Rhizomicrobium sp.]